MLLTTIIALTSASLASAPPADTLRTTARLEGPLAKGATARLVVRIDVKDGWTLGDAGLPNAVIQLDAPACARVVGDRANDAKALSKAGFLRLPEERMADGAETVFEFTLSAAPGADDSFAVNVLAYASPPGGADAWFIRQRISIPLRDDTRSVSANAAMSRWSGDDGLQLGDKPKLMKLPRADGSLVDLAEHLGKKNIVITTYRAFW
ncbi:MAG TPA: hypothetical protein P5081_22900 [Phycisphaerae bacterium]|nr:hypothetical protein [Phycisphaerae bacterium]HRW55731.1 hypothetical protein [Phycisphaerae bacterium]